MDRCGFLERRLKDVEFPSPLRKSLPKAPCHNLADEMAASLMDERLADFEQLDFLERRLREVEFSSPLHQALPKAPNLAEEMAASLRDEASTSEPEAEVADTMPPTELPDSQTTEDQVH